MIRTFIFLAIILAAVGCFNNNRWTDQQRKEFETKCSQTDTCKNLVIMFRGFDSNEFDSVLVKEFKDSLLLDSFKLFVWPSQSPWDKENKVRTADIERILNIHRKYQIIVPGQAPYELANMKMIMWAEYSETSEGWGCVMGDYTIDGIRFEHNANPEFIKR